jgi:hypothetical protein
MGKLPDFGRVVATEFLQAPVAQISGRARV